MASINSSVSDQVERASSVEPEPGGVKPAILEVHGLSKIYRTAGHELTVLRDIHLKLRAGDTCAIIGPSGSGKATLLGLCAGLDDATSGSVRLDGEELGPLD